MDPKDFERQVEALSALDDPVRRRLFRQVEARGELSRDQAARAAGVSRALAAFHLDKLVEAGLLEASFRRLSGRIIEEEGFAVKQGPKGKLMLQNESQNTTGLGLNFKLNVPRQKRQEILRDTVESLKTGVPLDAKMRGRLGWVNSTNPRAASRLVKAVKKVAGRGG